jgi:hypothetical protein
MSEDFVAVTKAEDLATGRMKWVMPAATKMKAIRLHQDWMPRGERHTEPDNRRRGKRRPARAAEPGSRVTVAEKPEDVGPATRIALRPVDRATGEISGLQSLADTRRPFLELLWALSADSAISVF